MFTGLLIQLCCGFSASEQFWCVDKTAVIQEESSAEFRCYPWLTWHIPKPACVCDAASSWADERGSITPWYCETLNFSQLDR